MKILFTGASSFTGYWFVKELLDAGHEVWVPFRRRLENYEGLRKIRVEGLLQRCFPVFECEYGSDKFLDLLKSHPWDLFCHHAADVTNYKSPDFDPIQALKNNCHHLAKVLEFVKKTCKRIVLTGSVFEQNEGAGSEGLRAVSPYGLSKGLTTDIYRFYCEIMEIKLGKFVIPNPFGPLEEVRFTSFLVQSWSEGKVPSIATPLYVRDNIPVSLLAKCYVKFSEMIASSQNFLFEKINPSGYVESQGAFAYRFAKEMSERLQMACPIEIKHQEVFTEPRVRINTNVLDSKTLNWKESEAWNELALFYKTFILQRT